MCRKPGCTLGQQIKVERVHGENFETRDEAARVFVESLRLLRWATAT